MKCKNLLLLLFICIININNSVANNLFSSKSCERLALFMFAYNSYKLLESYEKETFYFKLSLANDDTAYNLLMQLKNINTKYENIWLELYKNKDNKPQLRNLANYIGENEYKLAQRNISKRTLFFIANLFVVGFYFLK